MALTPGTAIAALVSRRVTRACGCGLNRSFAKSIPSARKSSASLPWRVTFAMRSRVVASDSRVRMWTQQELREEHPLRAKVFGVLALARDLRDEIGSRVVLSD